MRPLRIMMDKSDKEQFFEISAVSRLTGVSTPNIRVWEKRYQVVEPKRSETKRRLYTPEDIQRLTLLKALVDRGHAIGSIAALSTAQLEQRLEDHESVAPPEEKKALSCRLLVIGETLREQFAAPGDFAKGTEVVASLGTIDEAEEWAATSVDVVIIECGTLFEDTIPIVHELVKRTGALRAVIVYRFAQRTTLSLIDKGVRGITSLRAPISSEELRIVLQADVSLATRSPKKFAVMPMESKGEEIPVRRFTDKQLAAVSQASTAIDCECPQHLGDLLASLTAFEKYSAECERRSPADEALHGFLRQTTAQARAMMEHALQEVMEAEGITL